MFKKALQRTSIICGLYILLASSILHAQGFDIFVAQADETNGAILKTESVNPTPITLPLDTSRPRFLALDLPEEKLYWSEEDTGNILRADLDGTNQEVIATPLEGAAVALDLTNNHIFWSEGLSTKMITRANLDGTNQQNIITTNEFFAPVDLAFDPTSNKIYWTESGNYSIFRADIDGSNQETIITEPSTANIEGIAVDAANGKLYWCDPDNNTISRSNLDGANKEVIINDPNVSANAIAIDGTGGGTIYWVDKDNLVLAKHNITSGTTEIIITSDDGLFSPVDIALGFQFFPPEQTVPQTPTVTVNNEAREITFILQEFTIDFFFPELTSPTSQLVNKTPQVRYDVTARKTTGTIRRVVTKNNQAKLRLPAGTWSVDYRGIAVIKRKPLRQARATKKLDLAIKKFKQELESIPKSNTNARVKAQNKLQTAKAKRKLSKTRTAKKTLRSGSSATFVIN